MERVPTRMYRAYQVEVGLTLDGLSVNVAVAPHGGRETL